METSLQPKASTDTLRAWFFEVYKPAITPNAGYCLMKAWKQAFRWFEQYLGHEPTLADLTTENLVAAMNHLLGERKFSPSSADIVSMKLSALWRYLARNGVMTTWPPYPRPRAFKDKGLVVPKPKPQREPKRVRKKIRSRTKWMHDHPWREPDLLDWKSPLGLLVRMYDERKLLATNPLTAPKFVRAGAVLGKLLKRDPTIGDLTESNILNVMRYVLERGKSIGTANNYRAKLVALFNFAWKRGILRTGPDVQKLKEPKRKKPALTQEQIQRLWQEMSAADGMMGGVPKSDWFISLIAVIWSCGERVGALLQCKPEHVDFDRGTLFVPGEYRKWRTEDRLYPLSSLAVECLRRLLSVNRDRELIWPLETEDIHREYGKISKRAGVPCFRNKFHAWRRSFCTHLRAAGGDPQRVLRHSDPKILEDHYIDDTMIPATRPSDLLFRPDIKTLIVLKEGQ